MLKRLRTRIGTEEPMHQFMMPRLMTIHQVEHSVIAPFIPQTRRNQRKASVSVVVLHWFATGESHFAASASIMNGSGEDMGVERLRKNNSSGHRWREASIDKMEIYCRHCFFYCRLTSGVLRYPIHLQASSWTDERLFGDPIPGHAYPRPTILSIPP